ncbi:MAG: helix-hairpin-helix domain-containing protein [Verrucomicrobiota bacterium]
MALQYLFVDFNSYFASVEQEKRPELRGRPVGVVPVLAETTCCIAASYEAKKYGVKTGTRVSDARSLCPSIEIVESRPRVYVECHNQLVKAVESCLHVDEVLSIDEMVCELPANYRYHDKAIIMAERIKSTIAREVGEHLRSSIGIAPNPYLAKIASNLKKPDGLTCIDRPDLPSALIPLKLENIHGIGKRMVQRLRAHGICTVEELYAASRKELRLVWGGIEGERMYYNLRGDFVPRSPTKKTTIGHSHVLPPQERHEKQAFAVMNRLTQKAANRLRSNGYLAGGMQISIKFTGGRKWSETIQFFETQDTLEFMQLLHELWNRCPVFTTNHFSLRPIAVGVNFYHLVEENNHTPSLFTQNPKSENRSKLNTLVDQVNKKFGNNTIYFGGAHEALQSAPMRIAFNHIPDLITEDDGHHFKNEKSFQTARSAKHS